MEALSRDGATPQLAGRRARMPSTSRNRSTRRSPRRAARPWGTHRAIGLLGLALPAACAAAPDRTAQPDPPPLEVGVVPPPLPYAPGFDALHYHIALTVPEAGRRIDARTTLVIALRSPLQDTLRLDLTGLRAYDVRVGIGTRSGARPETAPFYQAEGRLVLAVPAGAGVGDTLHVHVAYGGEPDDGLVIGANVHGEWGAFGDNWPNRARFWFPSIDHPSDKATVSFEVRAPGGWRVLANGRLTEEPADGVWRYEMPVPLPTYLMVIGAARFAVGSVDDCADGGMAPARPDRCVPVTSWTFPADSAHGAHVFRRGGEMVEYYARAVGPYPYTKLAHAQAATRFGGMENAGAIFYSQDAVAERRDIEGTVAHETAHQWFGNAVTPHDWPHLWLSEGFATYYGALFFEHADGRDAFRERIDRARRAYLESHVRDLAMVDTLAIPGDNLLGLLNANSYQKGAAVLHMLRGMLGDDIFFSAVRRYYNDHVHGTAVTADLRRAFELEAGQGLGWFFDQWVFRPGHPVLRFDWRWDAPHGEAVVELEQVQDRDWPVFRLPFDIEFDTPTGTVRRTGELRDRRATVRFALPGPPTGARFDPDGWLLFAAADG
jgi:aminopeptidase N